MAGLIPFNKNGLGMRSGGFEGFYNMLDDFFNDDWSPSRNLFRDTFKVDVKEDEAEYTVEAEMPGIKKENISLDLTEGRLTIAVSQTEEKEEGDGKNYVHRERRQSSMQRSVYLADASSEGVSARLEDGVLHIAIPKVKAESRTRTIEIK